LTTTSSTIRAPGLSEVDLSIVDARDSHPPKPLRAMNGTTGTTVATVSWGARYGAETRAALNRSKTVVSTLRKPAPGSGSRW
jgi:hypothetical protein